MHRHVPPFRHSVPVSVFPRRLRAFTLIELLVVIAIIGILAAILVPVVGSARVTAKQAQSSSNLRQIGMGIMGFANENKGAFPLSTHGALYDLQEVSWIYTIKPYLGNVDEVRICPLDPDRDERLRRQLSSYVLSDQFKAQYKLGRLTKPAVSLNTLKAPARTHTVFVGPDKLPLALSNDHTHSDAWANNWANVCNDEQGISPDRFRVGPRSSDRTYGRSPYLYADGHVSVISATDFKRRIDAGENPAIPQ